MIVDDPLGEEVEVEGLPVRAEDDALLEHAETPIPTPIRLATTRARTDVDITLSPTLRRADRDVGCEGAKVVAGAAGTVRSGSTLVATPV